MRNFRPERHMGEDHDGGAGGTPLQVGLNPSDLIGAERAETARFELQNIDEPDEMHPP
jgi:hypothetical protein